MGEPVAGVSGAMVSRDRFPDAGYGCCGLDDEAPAGLRFEVGGSIASSDSLYGCLSAGNDLELERREFEDM